MTCIPNHKIPRAARAPYFIFAGATFFAMTLSGCSKASAPSSPPASKSSPATTGGRKYVTEQAGSFAVVQLYGDGFGKLTPTQRILAYHLAEAGIAGDPIYYDQIADYGLALKQLLESIWTHPAGIDAGALDKIRAYTKQVWIQHGNYNQDSARKFLPDFTSAQLHA